MNIMSTVCPVGSRSADFRRFAASLAGWQTAANLKFLSKQSVTELSASWQVGKVSNLPTSTNPRHSWVLEPFQVGENSPSYYVGEGDLGPPSLLASGLCGPVAEKTLRSSEITRSWSGLLCQEGQPVTDKTVLALHLAEHTGWALACPVSGITSGCEHFVERLKDGRLEVQRFNLWLTQHTCARPLERVVFNAMGRYLTLRMAQVFGALWGQLAAFCEPQGITCKSVSSVVCLQHLLGRSRTPHPSHRPQRPRSSKHHPADCMAALHRRGFTPENESEAQALATLLWALESQGVHHEN